MTSAVPIFESDLGYTDGGTFTPQQQGQPPAAPIPVDPPAAAPAAPTPAPSSPIVSPAAVVPIPTPREAPTALPVPEVAGIPRYSATDYASAARALLPQGRAWPVDPDSVLGRVLLAIGKVFERIDAAGQALLAGSRPGNLTPMLPEWEATLGLPDPCVGDSPTQAQRLDQVRGRFVGAGGQSRQHYIDFAAALGFQIEIVTYAPFRIGQTPLGQPLAESQWAFVWGVRILATTGALPAAALLCELEAIKPAESTVFLLA